MDNTTAVGTHVKKYNTVWKWKRFLFSFLKNIWHCQLTMEPTSSKIYVSKYSGVIAIKTSSSSGFLFTDDNVLAFGQNLYIFQESQVLNFNLWILVNYPL